jgi:hypothetical protein
VTEEGQKEMSALGGEREEGQASCMLGLCLGRESLHSNSRHAKHPVSNQCWVGKQVPWPGRGWRLLSAPAPKGRSDSHN